MQVTEQATIESLSARIKDLRDQQGSLKQSLDQVAEKTAKVSEQRRSMLIRGDAAIAEVVKLEGALADLAREGEGLKLRFDALDAPVAEAEAEWSGLAQVAAGRRMSELTEQFKTEAERLAYNRVALWRQSCRAAFVEAKFHENLEHSGLAQHQRLQIRQVALDIFDSTGATIFNEDWQRAVTFTAPLVIQPLQPPDSLKDLELLR